MKQYILYSLFILAGFLSACDNERSGLIETGTVVLGVDKNETLHTKAGTPVTDEKLQVYFINLDGDTTKFYTNYKQEVEGKKIILPVGSYTVKVASASTKEPAWETPSYYGEEDIEVTAGEIVQAAIECKISNTKVYVKYTESVKKYFSNYQATVSNTGGKLTYLKDEIRAGFFAPEKLTVDLKLTNKENGLTFDLRKVFPDIKPCYQYKLLFDVATPDEPGDSSGENVDIEINTDSLQVQITIKLPQYVENSDKKPIPKFAISTILADDSKPDGYETIITRIQDESGNYLDVVKEQTATIESSLGLKYLYVKLSDTFTGMPLMFDLLKKEIDPISLTTDEDKKNVEIHLAKLINKTMLPDGKRAQTYIVTMTAIDQQHQETEQVFTYTAKPDLPLSTLELTTADKWTTFAILRGAGADATDTYFEYKPNVESTWEKVVATKDHEGNIKAFITGLKANTNYSYRLIGVLNNEVREGEIYTFSTLDALSVPNMGFETWSKNGKTIYPGTQEEASNKDSFWDTGNMGASTMDKNPTENTSEKAIKGIAAKMTSQYVGVGSNLGQFAAGNIYVGRYLETFANLGNMGAKICFGRQYDARPTVLKGHYLYQPGTGKAYNPKELLQSGDSCAIYVALADQDFTFDNRDASQLINYETNRHIIAYGELDKSLCATKMDSYVEFTIYLKYRQKLLANTEPMYLILVASASKYGDYFTGVEGSLLYIDEFRFEYDYHEECFEGTNLEGLTPANK